MDRPVRTVTGVDAHEAAEIFARQFPAMYLRFHRRDAKGTALTPASRAALQHLALAGGDAVLHHRSADLVAAAVLDDDAERVTSRRRQ